MPSSKINIAVTGNAPFWHFDFNTLPLVRDALPNVLTTTGQPDIVVLKYARTTRDTYKDVRQVSEDIWGGDRKLFMPNPNADEQGSVDVHVILHFGMEVRTEQFYFETCARRDGYDQAGDDDGFVDSRRLKELGLPEVLHSGLDIRMAWERVKANFADVPIVLSQDAGLYFCEFRLYSSLAEAELHYPDKRGRVVFMHIPQKHDEEGIKLATDVAAAYIRAIAQDVILGKLKAE